MKLTKTQIECLKEINTYIDYPSYWKPKTREKLESLGLVENKNRNTRFAPAAYQLTEEGRLIMAKTPEGKIQEYGNTQLKARGCLVRKIAYEGRRGAPDTMVGVPERERPYPGSYNPMLGVVPAKIIFIEYKKDEATKPDDHQIREHERMRAVGMDVIVIGSKRQVDELIKDLFPCD